jgi:hypothetical protein
MPTMMGNPKIYLYTPPAAVAQNSPAPAGQGKSAPAREASPTQP